MKEKKPEIAVDRNVTLTLLIYLQGQHWTEKPKVVRAHNWGSFLPFFLSL